MALVGIVFLILLLGCTGISVVDLNDSNEEVVDSDEYNPEDLVVVEPDTSDNDSLVLDRDEDEIPPIEEMPGVIEEGNGQLKQELCPEQVLLAIKGCERYNGFLNITLKNQLANVSMIFYYLYDDITLSEEHSNEIIPSKEVRSYIINIKEAEAQYGEVKKIEATPVYTKEDGTMIACANKKLPVIVKASCN